MDPHLEQIPSLASFTTRCLPCTNLQRFGGETHGALDRQVLRFGTPDEFRADLLERCDFARGKGDANLVDFLGGGGSRLANP